MAARHLPILCLFALLGCPPPEETDKPDDTGADTGDPVEYEEGCITVDGTGGYARLNDAIAVASDGATIELCAGDFEEAVVVDKAVHIVGAGVDATFWSAPANEPAFLFQQVDGASLSGVDISSTRSGVELLEADNVALSDLGFDTIPNYAIDAESCSGLSVGSSSFLASQWGAIRIDGGDATISGSSFVDNLGFAVKGIGSADLAIQGNTISGTMYTELNEDKTISDGFAIFLEEAGDVSLGENTLEDNPIVAIFATSGDSLGLSGDTITGGIYGLYVVYGDLELVDVSIDDATEMGVLYVAPAGEALSVTGTSISGDPELVSDYPWEEGVISSIALYAECDHIDISDSELLGYNGYGALFVAYGTDDGELLMDGVRFDDNGRRGLFTADLDVLATELEFSNLRELDEDYDGQIYMDLPAAWYHQSGNLELVGGSFVDNQGWGLSAAQANVSVDGVTFSGNARSGFFEYAGTSTVQGSTFTDSLDGGGFGAACAYMSNGMVISGNTFQDNGEFQTEYVYDDGAGNKTTYVYHDEVLDNGLDVYAYDSTITVQGNSFVDGYLGTLIISSDATISDNDFSGYAYVSMYVNGEGANPVTLVDNTVSGSIGYAIQASSAEVEVDGLEFSKGQSAHIHYDYYYNGDLLFTSEYDTSYDAIYAYTSRLLVEDSTIDAPTGEGLYSYNSVVEVDDLTIRDAGSYGAYLYTSSADVEYYLSGLRIENPGSYGLYASTYNPTGFVAMDLYDVEISGAGSHGIYLSSVGSGAAASASIQGGSLTGNGGSGIYLSSSSATLEGATLEDNAGAGAYASGGTLIIDGANISSGSSSGVFASSGTLRLTDSTVSSNSGDGVEISGARGTITGNSITGNGGYGMRCTSSAIDTCGDNLVKGNLLGELDGCDAGCAEPLVTVIDSGDTGI
jgi:hypothetical protein